jgi:hypothetical protein
MRRRRAPRRYRTASRVYLPALPHACSSDDTATKLIPSPSYETAKPRISRRNTRLASTGRQAEGIRRRSTKAPREDAPEIGLVSAVSQARDRWTAQRSSWMRIRLPAGSRKAQSRTPYGWSIGSWTTSASLACSRSKVPSRSAVARLMEA